MKQTGTVSARDGAARPRLSPGFDNATCCANVTPRTEELANVRNPITPTMWRRTVRLAGLVVDI